MTTQPAGEHHTGTLDLTGEGNAPGSPISDDAVEAAAKEIYETPHDGLSRQGYAAAARDIQDLYRAEARAALEAAYPAIRQMVAEEIAVALEAVPAEVYPEDIFPVDGTSVDCQSARVMRFAYPAAARVAREIGEEA